MKYGMLSGPLLLFAFSVLLWTCGPSVSPPPRAPVKGACGADVVSPFDFATRDANLGKRGLIAGRRTIPDAHLIPGSVCSREPAIGAITLQNRSLHCTGTLISQRVVLTAAHCVHRVDSRRLRFVLGDNAQSTQAASYPVEQAREHPKYVHGCGSADLAVLVLQEDVLDAPALPYNKQTLQNRGQTLTYIGYGFAKYQNQEGAGIKRCADLPLEQVGRGWFQARLGAENVCHGDSGGPALQSFVGGVRIAGVTSWGDADCRRHAVSTDVGAYSAWLDKVVKDAAALRPNLRVAYNHTVVEMIDPASQGVGSIMDGIEPFPGFPYYSRASDNPDAWPERVLTDRQAFAEKIRGFFQEHPSAGVQGESSVEIVGSGPEPPGDNWRSVAQRYMGVRLLLNSDLHGDVKALAQRIGKGPAEAFGELEKARAYISRTMPNRLWVLHVRNESSTPAGPLKLKFKIAGMLYDTRASISQYSVSESTDSTTTIDIETIQSGEIIELRVWYNYQSANQRVFPDLRNFELDRTQGIVIEELKVGGARLVPAQELASKLRAGAYHIYEDVQL